MAVSRWERGVAEPSGSSYIRLGNMAGNPLGWFFWKDAGLRLSDVTRVLPREHLCIARAKVARVQIVHAGGSKRAPKKNSLVAIPLLPVHAGTSGFPGDNIDIAEAPIEDVLAAPSTWCPHPESTVCLRVKGNSMSPLILDGYIIAVDTSQIEGQLPFSASGTGERCSPSTSRPSGTRFRSLRGFWDLL